MRKSKYFFLLAALLFALSGCTAGTATSRPLSGKDIHTLVLVSDTQRYAQEDADTNMAMIKALADDAEKYHIEYVAHAGDLVQTPEHEDEWEVAKSALSQLDGIIPYGVLAGNHDQQTKDARFENYGRYFGDEFYSGRDYFGGSFENCRAHYQLVKIGNVEFVIVYISDDPNKACVEYANEIFSSYPDRVGILVTHKYLEADQSLEEMGEYMLEHIVKPNPNVAMVLCGHESAAGCLETGLSDGRRVLQIIGNYQDAGNGYMLYLQIDEAKGTITGMPYSPITNSSEGYPGNDTDRFSVSLPW